MKWFKMLAVLAVLVLAVGVAPQVARADEPEGKAKKVLVPLVFEKDIKNGKLPKPEDVVYGSCGYAFMYLYDGGTLKALIDFGANSSPNPPITLVEWQWTLYKKQSIYWAPKTSAAGTDFPWQNAWAKSNLRDVSTWGAGNYKAQLTSLRVTLLDGTLCVGLRPKDTEYIN